MCWKEKNLLSSLGVPLALSTPLILFPPCTHPSAPRLKTKLFELWCRDDTWSSVRGHWKWRFLGGCWRWTGSVPNVWCDQWQLGWGVNKQYQKIPCSGCKKENNWTHVGQSGVKHLTNLCSCDKQFASIIEKCVQCSWDVALFRAIIGVPPVFLSLLPWYCAPQILNYTISEKKGANKLQTPFLANSIYRRNPISKYQ